MSPSRGSGRVSPSPGPSQHSSHTLRSGRSHDSGEGSSRGDARHRAGSNGPAAIDLSNLRTKADERPISATYLGDNLVPDRDHGSKRRKRPGNSGGFLLDDAFQRTPERDSPRNGDRPMSRSERSPASRGSVKGKERSSQYGMNGGTVRRPEQRRIDRSASPMDVQSGSSPSNGSRPSQDLPRISLDTSEGSSAGLSPQHGRFSSEMESERWHQPIAQPSTMDSAQLVQMALALSESRRRHVSSTGHLAPPSTNTGRRITSAGAPALQGSYNGYNAGGSLKRYLNEQRRISRNMSPSHGRNTPPVRHVSTAYNTMGPLDVGIGQPRINTSDGTLTRVEKARQYIEMRSHYLRLLDNVPPLKPDAKAEGNTLMETTSGPGGTVQVKRVQSHVQHQQELGRQYNPLQAIRDRKLRARMRKPCNPDAEQWADLDSVIDWVDWVEDSATRSGYRDKDHVHLPPYATSDMPNGDHRVSSGHSRVESNSTGKFKKSKSDWYVNSEELFADAYWLEQGGHKGLVEDRNSNILFPGYVASHAERPQSSYSQQQQLKQSPEDAMVSNESIPTAESAESTDVDSPEKVHHRGRRRLFHRNREQSPNALRQLWQKRKDRSPSSDGLSDTDDEYVDGKPRAKRRHPTGDGLNVGPLERHMNSIMQDLDQTGSPELVSPGTPEKWGRGQHHNSRLDTDDPADHTATEKTPEHTPPKVLVHGDRADRKRPFPSLDTAFDSSTDMSAPNSPVTNKAPRAAMNASPSRDSSRTPGQKRRIPFLHHRSTKDHTRPVMHDAYAAEDSDTRSSRQPSAETDPVRTSVEDKRQLSSQQLAQWRTNDTFSSSTGSRRDGSDKEPGSAVSRFFKGGRVGDLIRGERPDFMWKREALPEEAPTSSRSSNYESESANEDPLGSKERHDQTAGLSKTSTNTSWASRALDRKTMNKPRYHIEGLPTFKSSQPASTSAIQNTMDKARPSRFNLLHPLRTDTNDLSRTSTRETSYQPANPSQSATADYDRRKSYGFLDPNYRTRDSSTHSDGRLVPDLDQSGTVGRLGLNMSSLRGIRDSDSESPSGGRRPMLDGHRHWSISDPSSLARQRSRSSAPAERSGSRPAQKRPMSVNVVSKVDVERVRALLLCTGIKAHTMFARASEVRSPDDHSGDFLPKVAKQTGQKLVPVPRKQEHVLAARMLVDDFDGSVDRLRKLAETFGGTTTYDLERDLERLKCVARDELAERSRGLGDEAGRIAMEVTTKGTRDVQGINETAQALVRARRRRMRWVRRMGWGVVEWLLLGIMWWVWLVVMVIKMVLNVVGGVGSVIRWLLFL